MRERVEQIVMVRIPFLLFILYCQISLAQSPKVIGNSTVHNDTIITYCLLGTHHNIVNEGDSLISFFSRKRVEAKIIRIDSISLKDFYAADDGDTTYNYLKNKYGVTIFSITKVKIKATGDNQGYNMAFTYRKTKMKVLSNGQLISGFKIGPYGKSQFKQIIQVGNSALAITPWNEDIPARIILVSRRVNPKVIYEYSEESPW